MKSLPGRRMDRPAMQLKRKANAMPLGKPRQPGKLILRLLKNRPIPMRQVVTPVADAKDAYAGLSAVRDNPLRDRIAGINGVTRRHWDIETALLELGDNSLNAVGCLWRDVPAFPD
jgi:hypothetical protein